MDIVGDISHYMGAQLRTLKTHGDINLIGQPLISIKGRLVGLAATKAVLVVSESHVAVFAGRGLVTGLKTKPNALDKVWPVTEVDAVRITSPHADSLSAKIPLNRGRVFMVQDRVPSLTILHSDGSYFSFVPEEHFEECHCMHPISSVLNRH